MLFDSGFIKELNRTLVRQQKESQVSEQTQGVKYLKKLASVNSSVAQRSKANRLESLLSMMSRV
jgi:DNA-directed RNA polymerase subunit F